MNTRCPFRSLASASTLALLAVAILPTFSAADEPNQPLEAKVQQWEEAVRARLNKDAKLKALAATHPLVVLHSRALYAKGGGYGWSCYSFIDQTADPRKHGNSVQLQFHNGGKPKTFGFNTKVGQQNLVVDLGKVDFRNTPDPARISIDHPGVLPGEGTAVEGHVYLERIRDDRGNNFYVLFQVVAVDKGSRYMAFLWRKLPGGKVVKP